MPQSVASRVTKNTAALLIGRASVMGFSVLFVIYAARFLGVEDFGRLELVRGYFELFLSLCTTGLSILLTREIAKRPEHGGRYLTCALVLILALMPFAWGMMVSLGYLLGYVAETRSAMLLACAALLPGTLSLLCAAVFVAFEKAEYVTYGTILENVVRNGLSFLALWLGYGVLALLGILIVARVCLLLFYLYAMRRCLPRFRWAYDGLFFKGLVREWRVFAYETWLSDLFWNLDVIVISTLHGERVVELYAAAYRLLNLGVAVADSYRTAIFPYLSRLVEESQERFQRLTEGSLTYMVVFVLPCVGVVAVCADDLIRLFYGQAYEAAVPMLRVLIWVLVLRYLNPFLSHLLYAQGKPRQTLLVAAISLLCHAGLAAWFIPKGGGGGAAWALLVSITLAFTLYLGFVMQGAQLQRMLTILGRILLAAVGAGLCLLMLQAQPTLLLLGGAVLVYVGLLFGLGVVPMMDDA